MKRNKAKTTESIEITENMVLIFPEDLIVHRDKNKIYRAAPKGKYTIEISGEYLRLHPLNDKIYGLTKFIIPTDEIKENIKKGIIKIAHQTVRNLLQGKLADTRLYHPNIQITKTGKEWLSFFENNIEGKAFEHLDSPGKIEYGTDISSRISYLLDPEGGALELWISILKFVYTDKEDTEPQKEKISNLDTVGLLTQLNALSPNTYTPDIDKEIQDIICIFKTAKLAKYINSYLENTENPEDIDKLNDLAVSLNMIYESVINGIKEINEKESRKE